MTIGCGLKMNEATSENAAKLHCECCNANMPNETSLAFHLKGKKHIQNVNRIKYREEEAERTLYVSGVQQLDAAELSLADYFSTFGTVAKVTIDKNKGAYAFVELNSKESAVQALQEKHHFINEKEIFVKPRELKLLTAKKLPEKHHLSHNQLPSDAWNALLEAVDVESQFHILQRQFSLPENDKHIRDLVCQLLTAALEEVFLSCEIQPFGSSVNGFGVPGCDMDLNFSYDAVDYEAALQFLMRDKDVGASSSDENENKLLDNKQTLSVVASIIRTCVPDCHQVKTILSARRPVVKFHHRASRIRCDISAGNELAVKNTEFIKHLCDTVPPFAPLVQAVRIWMKHWNLAGSTRAASGLLNNYAVTMMVLFYLYNCGELHNLDEMRGRDPGTIPCIIESWDCSFSENSPHNNIAVKRSLSELWAGFFHFYAKLDFDKKVLCLKTGQLQNVADLKEKPGGKNMARKGACEKNFKFGSLNVRDPFELSHNVAGNVGPKHMKIVVKCIRNAALACDMKLFSKKPGETGSKDPWGILNLFIDHHSKKLHGAKPKRSSTENESIEIKIDAQGMAISGNEIASLVASILTDVFLIDILSVSGGGRSFLESNIVSDDERDSAAADTAAVRLVESKQSVVKAEVEGVGSSRKRHRDEDTPVSEKRVKVTLTTPEAKTVKKNALFGERLHLPIRGEVRYRVWEGRRKARRQLVQPGVNDIIELEKKISKLLVSEAEAQDESFQSTSSEADTLNKQDLKTFFRFCMSMEPVGESVQGEYLLIFAHIPAEERTMRNPVQDFRNFVRHLQLSLPNMVSKCLKVT